MRRSVSVLALCVCSLLASCATVTRVPTREIPAPLSGIARDLSQPGTSAVSVETGARAGEYGCRVAYEVHRPSVRKSPVLVVLAHGFQRDLRAMRGWAALWASHGVETVVVSFCNSNWTAGNHDRNAADLAALAHALHDGPVLYAGFSAGGLAAFLAAAADDRAAAYLGLDAVDSGDLALPASRGFRVPALFLLGEPSACNAQGNFLPAIPGRPQTTALRMRRAAHGHFENPYDPAVESVCGAVEPTEASADILVAVRSLATAWVLDRCLGDQGAASVLEAARNAEGPWASRVTRLR